MTGLPRTFLLYSLILLGLQAERTGDETDWAMCFVGAGWVGGIWVCRQ